MVHLPFLGHSFDTDSGALEGAEAALGAEILFQVSSFMP